tara:strand:+ start:535 stop:1056 length:522 start_codon:yes stop_codon:yes gene_type:complete
MSDIVGLTQARHHLNISFSGDGLVIKVECLNHSTCDLVRLVEQDLADYPNQMVPTFLEWFDGEEPEVLHSGEINLFPENDFVAWSYVNPEPVVSREQGSEKTEHVIVTGEITPYWGVSVSLMFPEGDVWGTEETLEAYGGLEGEQFREGAVVLTDVSLWDEPADSNLVWQYRE